MKTLILSLLVLTLAFISNAQYVNIPDAHFESALISAGVDINDDGYISYAEAEAITELDVRGKNISDMTGIEAFVNLYGLDCENNQLTCLNVSYDTALYHLDCTGNQLTCLNVSGCTALEYLFCGENQLKSLDVSSCKALVALDCSTNQIVNLNLSKNINIFKGIPAYPPGIYLDLSSMPTLFEVCVWEMPFPPADKDDGVVYTIGSPNVYFTTDCSTSIQGDYKENSTINIYPNPSDGIINIDIENINNATIEIYDVNGSMIFSKALHSESEKIDISGFAEGIYLVKVKQDNSVIIEKVVVR
jgi:hypothetical protein